MLEPVFAAFARRLIFLGAAGLFGFAAYAAIETPIATPAPAFVMAALIALCCFWQDWQLERARKLAAALAEKGKAANGVINEIAELCAEHLGFGVRKK